ncbi:hypothetical protein T12_1741 [Trichinella patagoniensis]|uniref:Uncharacterized protein n=1 Tax=Trichinella patagoniensis TaxID=990121 RepID=A0A0V0ZPK0_9BILA|nr:hypothetical protein T12_1741 [Trichinella patagoniensis]
MNSFMIIFVGTKCQKYFIKIIYGYSWPPAETTKGHMLLCASLTEFMLLNSVEGIVSEISKVIQMLFTAAILILISLKICMVQVATCKDDGGRDVDW